VGLTISIKLIAQFILVHITTLHLPTNLLSFLKTLCQAQQCNKLLDLDAPVTHGFQVARTSMRLADAGVTTETPAGGRSCASVCNTPLLLAAFPTTKQQTSYACTAQNLPGYQSGNGATTCVVADGSMVMETQDYSCICLVSFLPGSGSFHCHACEVSCLPRI